MFELEQAHAFIANVNPRAEKHGDENVLATDIKIEVTLGNACLDEFDGALRAALYREVRAGEQQDLIGDNAFGAVRFPRIDAVKWDEEFPGYSITIESEMGLGDPIELDAVTLKKFAFAPMEGGSVAITFNAVCHPDAATTGALCQLIQDKCVLTLTPPAADELREAA